MTYAHYTARLIEWTVDEFDLIDARIQFDQLLRVGFTLEESFQMVIEVRCTDVPGRYASS